MLPFNRCALTNAGRAGSLKGTATRSPLPTAAAWASGTENTAMVANERMDVSFLIMTLTNMNISVQGFDFDFRSASGNASAGVPVCVEDKLCALPLFYRLARRQR